eukprot:jgi/Chlat1/2600/Chrsp178S02497
MDIKLARLALFLDPRYKGAATRTEDMKPLHRVAIAVMKKRGHNLQECERLLTQLAEYKAGLSPFNHPCGGDTFNLRAWWLAAGATRAEITTLAIVLLDLVPHAAAPERTFSTMGWFHSDKRNRMNALTTGMLAAVKVHHDNRKPM